MDNPCTTSTIGRVLAFPSGGRAGTVLHHRGPVVELAVLRRELLIQEWQWLISLDVFVDNLPVLLVWYIFDELRWADVVKIFIVVLVSLLSFVYWHHH